MNKITQLIVTRRGIIDIDDVTINDEVYTAKRRWRKVIAIKTIMTEDFIKSDYSFLTPIGINQDPVVLHKNLTSYYVPRDKNSDNRSLNYWFLLGKKLSGLSNLLNSDTFSIPINIILMEKKKCKAFIEGFFSTNPNYKNISKRSKLGLSFMLKKLDWGYEYRSTFKIKYKKYKLKNKLYEMKYLEVEEDKSYCINGLYVINSF